VVDYILDQTSFQTCRLNRLHGRRGKNRIFLFRLYFCTALRGMLWFGHLGCNEILVALRRQFRRDLDRPEKTICDILMELNLAKCP